MVCKETKKNMSDSFLSDLTERSEENSCQEGSSNLSNNSLQPCWAEKHLVMYEALNPEATTAKDHIHFYCCQPRTWIWVYGWMDLALSLKAYQPIDAFVFTTTLCRYCARRATFSKILQQHHSVLWQLRHRCAVLPHIIDIIWILWLWSRSRNAEFNVVLRNI